MKQLLPMIGALGLLLALGYRPPGRHLLTIRFRHIVGRQPLQLSSTRYSNRFGEPFLVEQFKYYISALSVIDQDGHEELLMQDPHLIDASDSASLTLHFSSGQLPIRTIRWLLGVDSAANTGGVQIGDLDPMRGMFWTWNSGYIYARLEGQSDSARAPAHRFTWDVGGYKANANAAREIVLAIPDGRGDDKSLVIEADLEKWFDGRQPIRLSQSPTCHEPGALAMRLADNYATMFSIAP
jgi:hypothetical protein